MVDTVPTSYHIEYYARIVERTALLRKLINAGGKIAALGYDEREELENTLDKAEQTLFEVSQRRSNQDFIHIGQVIDSYYEQINYLQEHRGEVVGVPTGFRDLDKLTGGLQKSDLIILAARPSVGKTSFCLSLGYNVATRHQRTVGIFSLEMSRDQLVQRLLSMDTRIDSHRLRTGHLSEAELQNVMEAMGRLAAVPIYIEDTPGMSIMEVRSKARRLQSQAGVDLIIIDYLQLMAGKRSDNRVQEVSEISRGLKSLARELNVPVIALSQLSRAVEGRSTHIPMLSDLRESGSIEQDADIVMFIYREELYDPGYRQERHRRAAHRQASQRPDRRRPNALRCRHDALRRPDIPIAGRVLRVLSFEHREFSTFAGAKNRKYHAAVRHEVPLSLSQGLSKGRRKLPFGVIPKKLQITLLNLQSAMLVICNRSGV